MLLNSEEEFLVQFPDDTSAEEYLISRRVGGGIYCPHCNSTKYYNISELYQGNRFKCANKACYKKFTWVTGTLLQASNLKIIGARKLLLWIYFYSSGRRNQNLSARKSETSQRTIWRRFSKFRDILPKNEKYESVLDCFNKTCEYLMNTYKDEPVI